MNLRKISFAISLAVVVETWVLFLYETSLKRAIGVYGVIFMLVPIGAWILVSPVITKRLREAGSKTDEPEVIARRFYRRFGPRYTVVGAVSTVIGVGLIVARRHPPLGMDGANMLPMGLVNIFVGCVLIYFGIYYMVRLSRMRRVGQT